MRASGASAAAAAGPSPAPRRERWSEDPHAPPAKIYVIGYGPTGLEEAPLTDLAEVGPSWQQKWPVVWVDVQGTGDTKNLRTLGELFGLHPLVLEDIATLGQRPKVEEYEDYNFVVLRMLIPNSGSDTEQLNIVMRKQVVITLQEPDSGDCLNPVRERLRRGLGRLRTWGADYLAYCLLDAVVDHYGPHLDSFSDRIEALERTIVMNPDPVILPRIYDLKYEIARLRRVIRPQRDAISRLYNEEIALFADDVKPFLRDCLDHAIRLIEVVETCRDGASSLTDLYMSAQSQRMNEIMKVLTMIATIFIPLSFIVGLYGMNFDFMPELHWKWSYPLVLSVMLVLVTSMLVYFRRKGWLGGETPPAHAQADSLDDA